MTDPLTRRQPDDTDFVEDVSAKIAGLLVDRGLDVDLAMGVVRDFVDYVRSPQGWGGQPIYIRKRAEFGISQRDREIVEMWTGQNTLEVCRKYGISRSQLYRLTDNVRNRKSHHRLI
jgi:hypothetical protein